MRLFWLAFLALPIVAYPQDKHRLRLPLKVAKRQLPFKHQARILEQVKADLNRDGRSDWAFILIGPLSYYADQPATIENLGRLSLGIYFGQPSGGYRLALQASNYFSEPEDWSGCNSCPTWDQIVLHQPVTLSASKGRLTIGQDDEKRTDSETYRWQNGAFELIATSRYLGALQGGSTYRWNLTTGRWSQREDGQYPSFEHGRRKLKHVPRLPHTTFGASLDE